LGEGVTELQWDEWDDWVRLQSRTGPNDPNSATRSGGWMGSSSHRAAILNGIYDDLGVGYVWDETDSGPIQLDRGAVFDAPLYSYWTQHFASGDSVEEPAPVPLPAAFWLLGSGLLGMVWVGRRREASV
ncbi:MAG: VPLPA-CTERM sorting domain-containing protein, partial [Candidatus Thiodiazotropha taylori]